MATSEASSIWAIKCRDSKNLGLKNRSHHKILVPKTVVFFTYSFARNLGLLYLFLFQKPWSSLLILVPKPSCTLLIVVPKTVVLLLILFPKTVVLFTYSGFKNRGLLYLFWFKKPWSSLLILVPKTVVCFTYSCFKNRGLLTYSYSKNRSLLYLF